MPDRVSLLAPLELNEIVAQHADVVASLRLYFSQASAEYSRRFAAYKESEVTSELEIRLNEHELITTFSILSSLEAAFRIDYLQRCYRKKKDPLSRGFRELHRRKGSRVSLEDEILNSWKCCSSAPDKLIGDLKGAFKFRHWLAHGRYWEPKLGQKYDYESVYVLAVTVFSSFPLEGIQ